MKLKDLLTTIIQGLGVGLVGTVVVIAGMSRLGYMEPVLPYVVMSGSMEPALPVGSVVLVSPKPFGYAPGNVITFRTSKKGDPITHRIVGLVEDETGLAYQTKGDANEEADFALIRPNQVLGEAFYMIPYLGTLAHFAKQPYGFIALVVIPATVIVWEELKTVLAELHKGAQASTQWLKRTKKRKHRAGFVATSFVSVSQPVVAEPKMVIRSMPMYTRSFVLVPILVVLSALVTFGTASYFSDDEVSVGNILGAASTFGDPIDPNPTIIPNDITPTPTPAIARTLVINEVLADASCFQGNTEAQWLEVYNGFAVPVNLKNFKITDGVNTIDLVTANNINVPAGGMALLAHNSAIWNDCYDDHGAITANLGGQLNIAAGTLRLLDSQNVVIDTVRSGSGETLQPVIDESIERAPMGWDTALGTNFNSADFLIMNPPSPGL